MMKSLLLSTLAVASAVAAAYAGAPPPSNYATAGIDGTKDAGYNAAITVQTLQTQFGNNTSGALIDNEGELDGLYLANDENYLYVMVAGNLGSGNNLYLFIDDVTTNSQTGGVLATLTGTKDDLLGADSLGGSTLPDGFDPDFALSWKRFNNPLDYIFIFADYRGTPRFGQTFPDVDGGAGANVNPFISNVTLAANPDAGDFAGTNWTFALNNSNVAGVEGGTSFTLGNPAAVNTGFETRFDLSLLGLEAGDTIRVWAIYSGGSFGGPVFLSNQFLPGLATEQGNVGDSVPFNFSGTGLACQTSAYQLAAPPASAKSWENYE